MRRILGKAGLSCLVLAGLYSFCACGSSNSTSKGPASGGSSGTSGSADAHDAGPDVLSGPVGTISTWTASAGRKVQPTTAPATTNAITVSSVRAAYVGSQLVVHGGSGHLQGVTATLAADLSDGAGHTLPKTEIALYREYNVDFTGLDKDITVGNSPAPASSPTQDSVVPDPLVPLLDPDSGANVGQPFDVAENTNVALFVDVHVPKGLAAGKYTGSVHVAANSGGASDIPITVTVYGIDLPDMRTVSTHFKMSLDSLIDFHPNVSACSGSGADSCYLDTNKAETKTLIKKYEELAHEHRIDAGQYLASQPTDGCKIPTDAEWQAYDNEMSPYMDGSYFKDGVGSGRYDTPFTPGQTYGVDGTCNQAQYTALATAWATHLTSKGWFPTMPNGGFGAVAYAFDEPLAAGGDVKAVLNKIVLNAGWLESSVSGSPSPWKAHIIDTVSPIAQTTQQVPATTPLLDPALGVYVVNLPEYGAGYQPWYGASDWQSKLFPQGIALWFYESNSVPPPYPTFATNTLDANEPVIMMWGSWYEKATGFLYWDISNWDESKDVWGVEDKFGKTGDGVLIYPGNHNGQKPGVGSPADVTYDGPIASYRLKMIRQGLQDWALFNYAATKGLTSAVQTQVKTVYTQLGGTSPAPANAPYWQTDDTKMDAARTAVINAILGAHH